MTMIKLASPRFAKIALTALCLASAGIAATSVPLAQSAYAKGRQADDGAKHDRNDDRGGRGGGADDPAGHR